MNHWEPCGRQRSGDGWEDVYREVDEDYEPLPITEKQVKESLGVLSDKQRFVVELTFGLRDGECYDTVEISKLMGISQQAVHRILSRALKRLYETVVKESP